MVGMPYHLEKGPWLSVLEDYVNRDQYQAFTYLQALRENRGGNLNDMDSSLIHRPGLNNDTDPFSKTVEDRRQHLNKDWYGIYEEPDGSWLAHHMLGFVESTMRKLPPSVQEGLRNAGALPGRNPTRQEVEHFADAVTGALTEYRYGSRDEVFHSWPTTGFWFQYFGDVQSILRETLIRALEVSLGLPHVRFGEEKTVSKGPEPRPDRHLPIEFFWKCPQRWFEGWVCWRSDKASGTGQVTAMLATPGHGKPVLESPLAGHEPVVDPPDSFWEPNGATGPEGPAPFPDAPGEQAPKGMWVITHSDHAQLPATPDEGATGSGIWTVPSFGPTYVGVGSIVTVAPSERDGGVRPTGRPGDIDTTLPPESVPGETPVEEVSEPKEAS